MGKVLKSITKAVITKPLKQISKETSRATSSVEKGFKKVTAHYIRPTLKNIVNGVGDVFDGGSSDSSDGSTVIQQGASEAKQRYSSEEGRATEQGATDLKARLGVNDRKKIKRLSTVVKK